MQKLSVRLIRQKSKQLNVPYQNLLIGCAREWVLEHLVENSTLNKILVQRISLLGIQAYRTRILNSLYFAVEQELLEENALVALIEESFDNISYKIREGQDEWIIRIMVPIDQLLLPIDVHISEKIGKKEQRQTSSFRLCYENEKQIEISNCNSETELAQFLIYCLEKMELLSDMTILDSIYAYLKNHPIEGRYLQSCIEDEMERMGIAFDQEYFDLFQVSMKSRLLKQRFQGYLRTGKRKDIVYDQVEELMEKAYLPILSAILKKEIFIGDWMPEVERYL